MVPSPSTSSPPSSPNRDSSIMDEEEDFMSDGESSIMVQGPTTPVSPPRTTPLVIRPRSLLRKMTYDWFIESSPHKELQDLQPLSPSSLTRDPLGISFRKNNNNKKKHSKDHEDDALLFETEEAIECFLPIDIDEYHYQNEIQIQISFQDEEEEEDDDEIIRIRNSFGDPNSDDDDDDDDDDSSCSSPTPMDPLVTTSQSSSTTTGNQHYTPSKYNIHDPKFQQAMDDFALERHGFDDTVGNYVMGEEQSSTRTGLPPPSTSEEVEPQEHEHSNVLRHVYMEDGSSFMINHTTKSLSPSMLLGAHMFTMESVTLNGDVEVSPTIMLDSYSDNGNDDDSDEVPSYSSICATPTKSPTRRSSRGRSTTRQVFFEKTNNNTTIRTELLGPPIKPASEMSRDEKKRLWWSHSDYRCFRHNFMCGVEEGFDTGFMCAPFRVAATSCSTSTISTGDGKSYRVVTKDE
mmetsp:Transcript_11721/g.16565  ORF Transcript_11721/g.16565 Transcript_11721/m.16565 type:complete len:461 (+) Transcript_11721:278-1660(+)